MSGFDAKWESIHASRQWGVTPNEHLVRYVRRTRMEDRAGKMVLDVGCGAGAQSKYLASQNFDVMAIDGSASAIKRCAPYGSKATDNPFYARGDATKIPFVEEHFDLVTDVCCLQHILPPDHIKAMQEIHRVLKPGGKFFSITARDDHSPSEDTPLRTMRGDEVKHLFIDSHFRITSLDHSAYTDRNGMYLASHWIVAAEKIT